MSGDGLLWEVVNGLMQRKDSLHAIKTPLGIIPAGFVYFSFFVSCFFLGTGNALAASLGSFKDHLTAVLYIIKVFSNVCFLFENV